MKNQHQQWADTRLVAIAIQMTKDGLVAFAQHNPTATLPELLEAVKVEPQSIVEHLNTLAADAARYRFLRRQALERSTSDEATPISTSEYDTYIDQGIAAETKTVVPFPRKR